MQGSKDEASVLTVLEMARNSGGVLDPQAIWDGLIRQAQEWNQTAGTFTAPHLPARLKEAVQPQLLKTQRDAVERLREHGEGSSWDREHGTRFLGYICHGLAWSMSLLAPSSRPTLSLYREPLALGSRL